jgi:hypothetical protein
MSARPVLQKLLAVLVGLVSGALCGGPLFGIPTYMDTSSGFLGTARSWTPLAVIAGSICGGLTGIVIGLIVAIVSAGKGYGALAGFLVGVCVAAYLLVDVSADDWQVQIVAFGSIPLSALVGLLSATISGLLRPKPPSVTDESTPQNISKPSVFGL